MAQEDRRRVLDMLAEGKISAAEAERLLEILDASHHRDGSGENAGRQNSQDPNIDDKIERSVITTVRSAVETARSIVSEIPGSLERPDGYEEAELSGERREDTFRVEDVPTLEVENFNGRVEIVGDSEERERQGNGDHKAPGPGGLFSYARRQPGRGADYSGRQTLLSGLEISEPWGAYKNFGSTGSQGGSL